MTRALLPALLFLLPGCSQDAAPSQSQTSMTPMEVADTAPVRTTPAPTSPAPDQGPQIWGYEVVATYPHEVQNFTQGLFIHDGVLYESTGKVGESALIRHGVLGDTTPRRTDLPADVFGEGSVAVGERIITLTWRDGVGFVHDLSTLEQTGQFALPGEGWGITYDGERLIVSDGTDRLRFLDPETFEQIGSVSVRLGNRVITRLNELEYIDGEVWANIWQTDVIARIDPVTGEVASLINLEGLYLDDVAPTNHVLNGIAYDPNEDRLFVTGKRWPHIFEIKLVPPSQ